MRFFFELTLQFTDFFKYFQDGSLIKTSGNQDIDPSRTQEFIGGVPIVSTESRRVVLGEDGEGYIVTGEIVSSQTISSKTRTVETVTVRY